MLRELRKIDESRPKAEVNGLPGVCFEQDGILFTSAGVEALPDDYAQATEEESPPDNPNDPMIGVVVIQGGDKEDEPRSAGIDTFENMHHMQLKALIRSYGLEWTDRTTAVAELRGLKRTA